MSSNWTDPPQYNTYNPYNPDPNASPQYDYSAGAPSNLTGEYSPQLPPGLGGQANYIPSTGFEPDANWQSSNEQRHTRPTVTFAATPSGSQHVSTASGSGQAAASSSSGAPSQSGRSGPLAGMRKFGSLVSKAAKGVERLSQQKSQEEQDEMMVSAFHRYLKTEVEGNLERQLGRASVKGGGSAIHLMKSLLDKESFEGHTELHFRTFATLDRRTYARVLRRTWGSGHLQQQVGRIENYGRDPNVRMKDAVRAMFMLADVETQKSEQLIDIYWTTRASGRTIDPMQELRRSIFPTSNRGGTSTGRG